MTQCAPWPEDREKASFANKIRRTNAPDSDVTNFAV